MPNVMLNIINFSDETEDIIWIYEEDNFIINSSKRKSGKSPRTVTHLLVFVCLFHELVSVVPRMLIML